MLNTLAATNRQSIASRDTRRLLYMLQVETEPWYKTWRITYKARTGR